MQKISTVLALILIGSAAAWFIPRQPEAPRKMSKKERIDGAIEYTKFTSSDVETGEVPFDKLLAAIEEGRSRLADIQPQGRSNGRSLSDAVWRTRGPVNRGGRTRAILIDEKDPNRNRIWVGGVSGGIWRTEDITQSDPQWEQLGDYFPSLSISHFAQDPNNLNTIYVSTGESYTNDVPGAGIWRTLDDGVTWERLASAQTATFNSVNEIYVHTNGDIYVATSSGGLIRSIDNGESWLKVLGVSLSGASNDNIHDFYFHEVNQTFLCIQRKFPF